ncbi:hypothetical protein OIU77_021184 [Salix suchowensis]|uniref:Secreted protein n=1 Tax=Salix suchowensis TaxID=1278906 RepID=A0ABQ9C919_9ROSI|nr:hypothetical protein OIU77_021184 [Salix suchowensis]
MGRERSSWCSEKRSPLFASALLSLCTTSISTAGSPDSLLRSLLQSTSLSFCSDATRNIPLKCEYCSSDPVQRGKPLVIVRDGFPSMCLLLSLCNTETVPISSSNTGISISVMDDVYLRATTLPMVRLAGLLAWFGPAVGC